MRCPLHSLVCTCINVALNNFLQVIVGHLCIGGLGPCRRGRRCRALAGRLLLLPLLLPLSTRQPVRWSSNREHNLAIPQLAHQSN